MSLHYRYQALLWLTLVPSLGLAQTPATQVHPVVRRGMFSTTPVGILQNSTGPSELLIINPGSAPGTPTGWTTARFGAVGANYPDYSLVGIFGTGYANYVHLAAISTGNDQIPNFDQEGQLLPFTSQLWFGLTISVTNSSGGISNSHPERVFDSGADSPGSELFTYYVEQSQGIDPSLVHTTISERSRETLGFVVPPNTPPANRVDVRGLDHGLGVIPFDRNGRAGEMFDQRTRFFFTVDATDFISYATNFAIAQGAAWNAPRTVNADTATIYECQWEYDSTLGTGAWSAPRVYRTASELGLDPEVDSIDALSVDAESGRIIYSTQVVAERNQILAHKYVSSGPAMHLKPLKTQDGTLMTTHLGLRSTEPDDVDGTCGIDPEAFLPNGGSLSGVIGTPEDTAYDPSAYISPLGISLAHVDGVSPVLTKLEIQVTGLSPASSASVLIYYVALRDIGINLTPLDPGAWNPIYAVTLPPGATTSNLIYPSTASIGPIPLSICAIQWELDPNNSYFILRPSWISSFIAN